MRRYTRNKRDKSENEIVVAIRACGWEVFDEIPVDLLCFKNGVWRPLEVKTPTKSGRLPKRKDQQEQNEFCERTGTPRVGTIEGALAALGEKLTFGGV